MYKNSKKKPNFVATCITHACHSVCIAVADSFFEQINYV